MLKPSPQLPPPPPPALRPVRDWFDLGEVYAAYKADHSDPRNMALHTLADPLISIPLLAVLWLVPLPANVPLPPLVTTCLALYYARLHAGVGVAMVPVHGAYVLAAAALRERLGVFGTLAAAVAANVVGWHMLFWSHARFERNRPTITNNFVLACLSEPITIFLDVMFAVGAFPALRARLADACVHYNARLKTINAYT